MTENAILDNNKGKYMDMFNELQGITNDIHNLKQIIITKNEDFVKIKNDKFKPDPENEQFFKNLDQFVQLARQKEIQLQQGLNFYKQFNLKLNEKIPHKIDSGAIKNCKEAIELRSLLDELEIKKEKAMEI